MQERILVCKRLAKLVFLINERCDRIHYDNDGVPYRDKSRPTLLQSFEVIAEPPQKCEKNRNQTACEQGSGADSVKHVKQLHDHIDEIANNIEHESRVLELVSQHVRFVLLLHFGV